MVWPLTKKTAKSDKRLVLQPGETGLYAAIVAPSAPLSCSVIPCQAGTPGAAALQDFVEQHELQGARTELLLGLDDYQMLLVEAPPVDAAELADALKWKVKDLLAQSVEQSLIDGFLLPEDAFRGRQKMAYAAATAREPVQALVDKLEACGLHLSGVSIAELGLLPPLAAQGDNPGILLVIGESGGFLSMVADGAIYLVRQLELKQGELSAGVELANAALEKLVLEIQRSRDYFESQMGKGAISRLFLLPMDYASLSLDALLKERLGLPVEKLDIDAGGDSAAAEQLIVAAAARAA